MFKKVIIQAGGRGSRLERLTHNRPKALVPYFGKPLIFWQFEAFREASFSIIADYKADVLEKYLAIFAKDVKYKIIRPKHSGTASGINEAISEFDEDEPFLIIWCDLVLGEIWCDFLQKDSIKDNKITNNFIGIAGDFTCRWSFKNNELKKEQSAEFGVAGLFIFRNKKELLNCPCSGAFVRFLQGSDIKFCELKLQNTKELGTMIVYEKECVNAPICRPFNSIEFQKDRVLKKPISPKGKQIAKDEIAWYKAAKEFGFTQIPQIYSFEPLILERINGKNIFEYDFLTKSQKRDILMQILDSISTLHSLNSKPAILADIQKTYIDNIFIRLNSISGLVPFMNEKFIRINGRWVRNILFFKDELKKRVFELAPNEFNFIHGDCTFSNILFEPQNMRIVFIDPRGYFGDTKLFGDRDYDFAKIYYSFCGRYDEFNRRKFALSIESDYIELAIKPNNWEDCVDFFFEKSGAKREKITLLHGLIWLGLSAYAWDDYDQICGAFYNGLLNLGEVF